MEIVKTHTVSTENIGKEFSFQCSRAIPPVIPDGEYEAAFIRAETKRMWGQLKIFLWFRIINSGENFDVELFLACQVPQKLTISCKYYRAWVVAAGRRPDRFEAQRMTPNVFRGKAFRVQVRVVKKDAEQRPLPPALHYSIIHKLIEKVIG